MKTEIEHVQHLLQKSKVQIQRNFEEWWKKSQQSSNKKLSPRAAWHTPPLLLRPGTQSSASTLEHEVSQSGSRPSRHQAAIAAQFTHQHTSSGDRGNSRQSLSPPGSVARTERGLKTQMVGQVDSRSGDGTRMAGTLGLSSGRAEGTTTKNGSVYPSSWQQANSFSLQTALPETPASPGATDQYLSKQRALFPTKLDSHSRLDTCTRLGHNSRRVWVNHLCWQSCLT